MSRVDLYIYDLSQGLARALSPTIVGKQIDGVWHTGVVIWGIEYFYGGGIVAARAGTAVPGMRYDVHPLGTTSKTKSELEAFLRSIAHRFTAETYQMLRHNCNTFSNEVANFLLGSGIPRYIIDLPGEVINTPIGQMIQSFEGQIRRRTAGNSPLNPFGTVEALPVPDTRRSIIPVRFGPNDELLKLSVQKLNSPSCSTFFSRPDYTRKIGPADLFVPVFSRAEASGILALQTACLLRHAFLCDRPPVPIGLFSNWLSTVSTDCADDSVRVAVIMAACNSVPHAESCREICAHIGLHALSVSHIGSRRAAGKLLQNICLYCQDDIFVLVFTTLLTRLDEEIDAVAAGELLQAIAAGLEQKGAAARQIVTDVIGGEIDMTRVPVPVKDTQPVLDGLGRIKRI